MLFPNIVSASQFKDRDLVERLFVTAHNMEGRRASGNHLATLSGKVVATVFHEPSTRTRLTFEVAVQHLGGTIVSVENAAENSSASKGETIADEARVLSQMVNCIVLRHRVPGTAAIAAEYATVPVINAGDGIRQHPTQGLLDMYAIHRERSPVEGLNVSIVGDLLNGRTVHSLVELLPLFEPACITLVSPPSLDMPGEITTQLADRGVRVIIERELNAVLEESDVIYMTRIQQERFKNGEEYEAVKGSFCLDDAALARMKSDAIIMHPGPRNDEIATEVDNDPRAIYFKQVGHGLNLRMALLHEMFDPRGILRG